MKKLLYAALPVGLALMVIASGWSFIAPRSAPTINRITLFVGIALFVAGLWGRRSILAERSGGQRVKFGASAAASAGVLLLLLLLVNFFAARHHQRWDLTRFKSFSLHPVTERVLRSIDRNVDVYAFVSDPMTNRMVKQLYDIVNLEQPNVKITVADPNQRPDLLEKLGVRGSNLSAVVCGDRKVVFPGFEEADLAAALIEATRQTPKAIYWLIGDGERAMSATGGVGYLRLQRELKREYFQLNELALGPVDKIPSDAAMIVIADPKRALPAYLVDDLDRFLRQGGRVLALGDVDYSQAVGVSGALDEFLARWGLSLSRAVVFDPRSRTGETDPRMVVGEWFGDHPAVKALAGGRVLLPQARPVEFRTVMADQQIFFQRLVQVGQNVAKVENTPYVQADLDRAKAGTIDPATQKNWIEQPINLATAAFRKFEPQPGDTRSGREARLVAIGDADFMTDAGWDKERNGELVLNLIRWLTGEELLIRREGEKLYAKQAMAISPDQQQTIQALVIVGPLIVGLFGAVLWFVRRSR